MIYRTIPHTDLKPAVICMGGGALCVADALEYSCKILDQYRDGGGNFVDTANIYGKWLPEASNISEQYIGAWMKRRGNRHQIILATKGGHPDLATMQISRLSKAEVAADLEESLKTLGTDYIDLYWLHRDDETLPVAAILDYLNEFVREGKIRYFGCSNWKPGRIAAALRLAAEQGIQGFAGNQMMWSLALPNPAAMPDQTMVCMDAAGLALHAQTNLAAIPYSSQANGFFNKLEQQGAASLSAGVAELYVNETNLIRFAKLQQLARELSRTVTEIVLGYLISQPFATIPIVGCHTSAQLAESMKAGDLMLSETMLQFLEGSGPQ